MFATILTQIAKYWQQWNVFTWYF